MSTPDPVVVPVPELRQWCAGVLEALGQAPTNAEVAAEVLVRTTARGFRSHGVELLPMYASWMRSGAVVGDARPEVVHTSGAVAVVEAHGALGQVAATTAVRVAGDLADRHGLGMVTVRGSNHAGALGHYVLTEAERGHLAVAWSSAPPTMHAPGGRGRLIGNGPTAYGVPRAGQPPVVFDAAMSVGAGGKVAQARARGETLPDGWILDRDGRPTTRPEDAAEGSFVPIGEHKGFGLALLAEMLSTCLAGATLSGDLPPLQPPPRTPFGMGHAFLVIDGDRFGADSKGEASRLSDLVRGSALRRGSEEVVTPGDRAHAREQAALRDGVVFDEATWARLEAVRASR
ncbi:Ldh family oxidoreductase [Nocardioides humi]|uniref:Ldh family oxidoreductase n=1 Tax=Nocardioides humi TaxID=449461 RepID=A0ABN2AEA4_9ACTN|nr:Ldh family oxidoreductase [Nocardioides humi]